MEKINNDIFLNIMDYLVVNDKFFFVSSMSGKNIGVSFLMHRDIYFRKISANKLKLCFLNNSTKLINEEINRLIYYKKFQCKNISNIQFLDYIFYWLTNKMNTFLLNTNIHQYISQSDNYFNRKIIVKKIAYSTGLRDKVFIKESGLACSVYGCKMMGSTRRKIMRSLLLKALVG